MDRAALLDRCLREAPTVEAALQLAERVLTFSNGAAPGDPPSPPAPKPPRRRKTPAPENKSRKAPPENKHAETDAAVLATIRGAGSEGIGRRDVVTALKITTHVANRTLARLLKGKHIVRSGKGVASRYSARAAASPRRNGGAHAAAAAPAAPLEPEPPKRGPALHLSDAEVAAARQQFHAAMDVTAGRPFKDNLDRTESCWSAALGSARFVDTEQRA